jgi:hypothetical protein
MDMIKSSSKPSPKPSAVGSSSSPAGQQETKEKNPQATAKAPSTTATAPSFVDLTPEEEEQLLRYYGHYTFRDFEQMSEREWSRLAKVVGTEVPSMHFQLSSRLLCL